MSAAPAVRAAACPYCLAALADEEARTSCPSCGAVYHTECWTENGGCAVYGCDRVPFVEGRAAHEVPASYWGQEHKPCPHCGQTILAAAMRCRHCGATFASARPQDLEEFEHDRSIQDALPKARSTVVRIFVCSVVPLLAPIGAIWGALWRRRNAKALDALPPIYGALSRIGLIASVAVTVAIVVFSLVYAAFRGG